MGNFAVAAKNTMLDALTVDRIMLHSGDPGADGTANQVAGTLHAATFAAADAGQRLLSADVEYTGLTPLQTITYLSFWNNNGGSPIFHGSDDLTGDLAANAAGEYTVKATTTKVYLPDPA